MNFRTDLAVELRENAGQDIKGVECETLRLGFAEITRINIVNDNGAKIMGRKIGKYVTIEVPGMTDNADDEDVIRAVRKELSLFLPERGTVLFAGIGNKKITPDALGPICAQRVLATRHISSELKRSVGLDGLRSVAVISPGVLGSTGIETGEIIASVCDRIKPSAVIVVDALAARNLSRLGTTVQISDTGIYPGSGVQNRRAEIGREKLGVPVISIGVPTVVDCQTLVNDLLDGSSRQENGGDEKHMVVTPSEIDLLIDRAAHIIAHAVNCALHPTVSPEILLSLM